jgi:hypothetical protein
MKLKRLLLFLWNYWPPFLGAGIKIVKCAPDYRHMKIRLKLRFWSSNYVGTQFGGSMFAMTDPFYMIMLLQNLGDEFIVWDKSASIKFIKPGRKDVFADFNLDQSTLELIKQRALSEGRYNWTTTVDIVDIDGEKIAQVEKTIYIRPKDKRI